MSEPTAQQNGLTYLTVPEVAKLMGVSQIQVREWARNKQFGAFKKGSAYLFPSERMEMLAVEDVATLLSVNVQTVRRWARDKMYPTIMLGRRYYFSRKRLMQALHDETATA